MKLEDRNRDEARAKDVENFLGAANKAYLPRWLHDVLWLGFYAFVLVKFGITSQALGLRSTGFGSVAAWVGAMFASWCLCLFITHTFVGPALFYSFTRISYRSDRMAYARAGGYDADKWPILLTQAGLFGFYWWTSRTEPDPIAFARGGWGFILSSVVLAIPLTTIVCSIAFSSFARSRR